MRILNLLLTIVLSVAALWLLAWGVAAPATALSAVHYVAPDGNCAGMTPCYATLQAAIDAAVSGDEVLVAQGVYTTVAEAQYVSGGSLQTTVQAMFINKTLTLLGGYNTADWETAQPASYPAIIDPQGLGRGGTIVAPDPNTPILVTLEGFTIVNGYAETGGGLYADGGEVVIRDCYVLSNTDGLLLWNNRATLRNAVIAANAGVGLTVLGGQARAWHTTLAANGEVGVWAQHSAQGAARVAMTNTILAGPAIGLRIEGTVGDPTVVRMAATLWQNYTHVLILDEEAGQLIHSRDSIGDPGFMGVGDYRLTPTSRARNRGGSSPVRYDIIGVPRDPLPDLGAYEYDDPDSIRQVFLPAVMRGATGAQAH